MERDGSAPLLYQRVDTPIAPTALSRLLLAIGQFWRHAAVIVDPLPDAEAQHAILAATMEIAENVVHHAYVTHDPANWLSVEFSLFGDCVEVVLSDGGRIFESTLADPADLSVLWERSVRGGWGLLLAQKVVDEFSYTRTNGINHWRLLKQFATKFAKIDDSCDG